MLVSFHRPNALPKGQPARKVKDSYSGYADIRSCGGSEDVYAPKMRRKVQRIKVSRFLRCSNANANSGQIARCIV